MDRFHCGRDVYPTYHIRSVLYTLAPQLLPSEAPGVPPEAHANYRSRPGTPLAVLSLSKLPPAPAGRVYQAWLRYEGVWVSLGTAVPDADGRARIVAEGPALAGPVEALQVTLERAHGAEVPSDRLVVAWPKP